MENAQLKEMTVPELARHMSHELRTPLTSITGFAELLLEDESITGSAREYSEIIFDEAKRLTEMLTEFLSIMKGDAEKSIEGTN